MNYRDVFDVYLVSLPKDTERRQKMGLLPDYTYSVNGLELDIDKLKHNNILSEESTLTKGEIGCYLSHTQLLNKALMSEKMVLILEDDAKIEADTFTKIKNILNEPSLPTDWDILFLGYNYFEEYTTFRHVNYMHGAHAYLVNTRHITKEKINNLYPITQPYDVILPVKLQTYVIEPKIIELNSDFGGFSNTQNIR